MATNQNNPLNLKSADTDFILRLLPAQNKEREVPWNLFCGPNGIDKLIDFIANTLFVDASRLSGITGIIVSQGKPSRENRDKVWVKTSVPRGIGIPLAGGYDMIYKYPDKAILLWQDSNDLPQELTQLSDAEAADIGLPELGTGSSYVQFNAPTI